MKFTLAATIPTGQYANVQPSIEVEAATFEEAYAQALPQLQKVWNDVCEPGKELNISAAVGTTQMQATTLRRLESELTGGFALFDDATHTYTDEAGNVYLSGSVFCKRYSEPFPREAILPKMATKYGVKADDISAMWELKREASSSFGTGLHAALELYGKYAQLGAKTGKDGANSALHDQPIIQKVVEEFYSDRKNETAYYEPFVVDVDGKLCGQIDRLLITGEKLCRVQDFKTNADINKVNSPTTLKKPFGNMKNTNRNLYWLQLSFYAHILKKAGWTVEGLDIFHYTDKWETYSADPIDLSAVLN